MLSVKATGESCPWGATLWLALYGLLSHVSVRAPQNAMIGWMRSSINKRLVTAQYSPKSPNLSLFPLQRPNRETAKSAECEVRGPDCPYPYVFAMNTSMYYKLLTTRMAGYVEKILVSFVCSVLPDLACLRYLPTSLAVPSVACHLKP